MMLGLSEASSIKHIQAVILITYLEHGVLKEKVTLKNGTVAQRKFMQLMITVH